MAKKEKDILAWVFRNFINSLKPRKFTGDQVGTDRFGNKYFEIPAGGNRAKRARYFEPIDKEEGFDREVPAEWEAWLRGRRSQPPTEEELDKNYQYMLEVKRKAQEIDLKFKLPVDDKPEVKEVTGIAPFPKYKEYEIAPGTMPGSKKP